MLSGLPIAGVASPAAAAVTHLSHVAVPAAVHATNAAVSHATAHPAFTTNASLGPVYASTSIAPAPSANVPCNWYNYTYSNITYYEYHYCYPTTQNPSILTLANGNLGMAYSIYTTAGLLCNSTGGTNLTSWTSTSVAWSSSTNGTSWGTPAIIGLSTCRWPSSSEPSFATGSGDSVYGAFIISNKSVNTSAPSIYYGGTQPIFPPDWTNSTGDAIAFVSSHNNGSTWSSVTPLAGITSAEKPQIAVDGQSIYIAYINVSNGSALYPGAPYTVSVPALSVQLIASLNGGSTWSKPVTLTGWNSSMANWSTSPSIAVDKSGTVGVAYATNRTCVLNCYYLPGAYYAEQIVYSSSTNNGSTWSAPVVAGNFTGESFYYQDYNDRYYYQFEEPWMATPQTAIAFNATGQSVYIGYSGTYLKTTAIPYYNWEYSGVFATASNDGGLTWTQSTIQATNSTSIYDNVYSPGIAVSGSTVYIAYVWANDTYCYIQPCSPFAGGYSSWIASSTNGVTWTSTYTGISAMPGPYYAESGFQGWQSTVTIGSNGLPVTATTLPGRYSFVIGYNGSIPVYTETYYANVSVGYEYNATTTYAVFTEHNLKPGTPWGVTVDGYIAQGNGSSINVSKVPIGLGLLIGVLPESSSYRTIETSSLSVPTYTQFSGPTNVDVNYSIEYGVWFSLEPTQIPDAEIYIDYGNQFYYIEGCPYTFCPEYNPALPWYFPANVTLQFTGFGEPPITYWNGTGNGSYTGGGQDLNLTLHGPVNETAWAGTYGVYSEQFTASGLPSTSVYSFDFNGNTYSAPSTSPTNVSGVPTGGYSVSDITANSTTAGWEYFGWIPGGSNVVVVPAQPTVAFQFAYVNVGTPAGQVTFHATGIGTGTVWSVEFNGTYYSASTPWLNVSTHTGTFPWAVGAAVAANASVGYAPVGTGGSVSVTTGSTVNIAYTSAYRVDIIAGLGGAVSGAGNHWLASGALATYTAAPANGYSFGGWTGTGAGSYTGTNVTASVTANGAVTETASFYPLPSARFNVTFQQTTIPAGTWWTVYLNGVGYSSNSGSMTVSNLLSCAAGVAGQYNESVPYAYDNASGTTRYMAVSPTHSFCTNGGLLQPLTFVPEYQVTVSATPGGTAYVADSVTSVVSNESLWAQPTDTVQLTAVHTLGYSFGGWNGTGTGAYAGSSVSPPISVGGPVVEFATFVPIPTPPKPTYTETFISSVAFPLGTSWSVKIGTTSYGGVGPKIVVAGLAPAIYSVTVSVATSSDGGTRWSPASAAAFPLHVTASANQTVTYGKPSYWVTIGGSAGGSEIPSSGWYVTGSSLVLNATPNLGESFVSWQGTGDGNYTGNLTGTTVVVSGEITEFASFQPVPKAVTVITSFWSSTTTWAILGLVGLLVGLIVGIAVRRFRTSPATTQGAAPWGSGEPAAGGGSGGPATEGTP